MEDVRLLIALEWALPVALLLLGYAVGRRRERQHMASLKERERILSEVLVTNLKGLPAGWQAGEAWLERGEVVISSDAFKTFAARLRGMIGGRIHALETLVERARREAIVRLAERALEKGATHILNLRLETGNIASAPAEGQGMVAAEVLAYGTAVIARQK